MTEIYAREIMNEKNHLCNFKFLCSWLIGMYLLRYACVLVFNTEYAFSASLYYSNV